MSDENKSHVPKRTMTGRELSNVTGVILLIAAAVVGAVLGFAAVGFWKTVVTPLIKHLTQ